MRRYFLSCAVASLVALLVGSWSWAGIADQPYRKGYGHSESTPHLWLYWNCVPEEGKTMTIDGIAEVKGQSNSPVYGLQLKLIGYNAKEKKISEQLVKIAPYKLFSDMPNPFRISLPLKREEVDFGLYVFYWFYPVYGGDRPRASRISYIYDTWYFTFRDICPKD
jgi:hypothetical protein